MLILLMLQHLPLCHHVSATVQIQHFHAIHDANLSSSMPHANCGHTHQHLLETTDQGDLCQCMCHPLHTWRQWPWAPWPCHDSHRIHHCCWHGLPAPSTSRTDTHACHQSQCCNMPRKHPVVQFCHQGAQHCHNSSGRNQKATPYCHQSNLLS